MVATVVPTQGAKLFISSTGVGGALVEVVGLKQITSFGFSKELEDITNLASTAKEYRLKLNDGKEFTAEVQFNPDNLDHRAIELLSQAGTKTDIAVENAVWNKSAQSVVTTDFGSDNDFTAVAHGLVVGQEVDFTNDGGALPAPIVAGTTYHVISAGLAVDDFRVSVTPGGTEVALTSDGTGVHSVNFKAPTITRYAFEAFIVDVDKSWPEDTIEMMNLSIKPTGSVVITDETPA